MLTLVRDRYEVLAPLGSGGEARVVKALDRQHDRLVVLKIRPVPDGAVREELLGEARVLLALPPHPGLPLVREDFFEGGTYVVAMDWVDGTDLATLVAERGRPGLEPSSVLGYLAQAAEALTHLHTQSPPVLHGDVKPGNLILTRGGRVMLVDFGLSSAPNVPLRRAGTPGYRAPELAAGASPSRASDVYGLAATAFALLTGAPPAGVLPRWEGVPAEQAEQLEAAIRLGMATHPARRPRTAGELVERLRAGWAATLPTGVVTFCTSTIADSAGLWDDHPDAMAEALVRHDALIADAVSAHAGRFVKATGDGTVSVFDAPVAAVAAALAATRALATEPWPGGLSIAAGWGLHTGEAEPRGADFVGATANLAARVRDQADAGQIVLSAVTAELVAGHLPDGCSLVDLGADPVAGRISALAGPGVRAPLGATECPYRGLPAFEPDDRRFFFGREQVVGELIGRLAPGRLLAVVGASGSGKSSVLRAGLVAAVRAGEVDRLRRAALLEPGAAPAFDHDLAPDRLVVVDQFEELFTLCLDTAMRRAFIDVLLRVPGPVVIGLRADLYERIAEHPALARAVAGNQVLLGSMDDAELERAVREPARLAGLRLEPGLVELALRDVADEPGALPLLSHALRSTWERRDGRTLTVVGYREAGGVSAAIARTADGVIGSLPAEQHRLVRSVFLRLTELGDGGADTRRRVRIDELLPEGVSPQIVGGLLERLADARLVTLGEGTAEVAHEVLIREWPTLRGWLDEDRDSVHLHRRLGDAAQLWEAGAREPTDLYRGTRLDAAADWAAAHRHELNASERAFVDASVARADRERRAERRTNRRLRGLLAGAVVLLALALVAGVVSLAQRNRARAEALTSDAQRIGAQALTERNVDRALLDAVAAVRLQNRAESRSDLLAVLQKNSALVRMRRPFRDLLDGVQVSPDGRLLAVADSSGAVRFMDMATWKSDGADVRLGDPVAPRALSFSPDGRTLMAVTVGRAQSELVAIDVPTRRARRIRSWRGAVPPPPNGSAGVAYSADGRRIAVSVITELPSDPVPTAERVVLLDASSGRMLWERRYPTRPGQEEPHVAFTPAGALLTSAQHGDTLLWDVRDGRILRRFRVGGLPAISADGRAVALGRNSPFPRNASASVAVLDLRSGRQRTLQAKLPAAWIRGIAFTPDGSKIVAGGFDGVHVWDVAAGTISDSFVGQPGQRSVFTLVPRGETAIFGAQDGSVAAFDVAGVRGAGHVLRWSGPGGCGGLGACDAVDSRSTLLADSQGDGSVVLSDLRTGRPLRPLPARDGRNAAALSFLPDGTLVDGGNNGKVTLWDTRTGRVDRELRFPDPVTWTAPSPDGRFLAVQTQPAGSQQFRVTLVALPGGRELQSHAVHAVSSGVRFTPDGRELVALGCCVHGSTLVAWDAHSGRRLFGWSAADSASAIDVDADARMAAVAREDGKVLFLDARNGRPLRPPLQAAAGNIDSISFSPDGRTLAVGAVDNSVSVWDLGSRARLGSPFGPYVGWIPETLFEPNGRLLVMQPGGAIEWPTGVLAWERLACRDAGRDLTRAEWNDLLPNRAYRPVCPVA